MVVQNQSQLGEGSVIPTEPHHTPTFIQVPQKIQHPRKPKRKDTQVPQPSDPVENVTDEAVHKELGDSLVRAATTASSFRSKKDRVVVVPGAKKPWGILLLELESSGDEESLGEDASKQGRIDAIDADKEITLVSVHDVNVSAGEEVFVAEQDVVEEAVEVINTGKLIIDAAQDSAAGDIVSTTTAATTVSVSITNTATTRAVNELDEHERSLVHVHEEMFDVNVLDGEEVFVVEQEVANEKDDDGEITLAQALIEMKSTKPKDKGKGILIEPVEPMKKKDLIRLDEETTLKLQAEFDEKERLAREKAKKEKEANIALIETWDDIHAKIDVDHQLAERLQAQEQEELSIKEKATLFQQLLEKKRKHFAAKTAEEKRNKPPTKAQLKKIMCTYLKNMEGYKLSDLKLKDFDSIQEMFDRAFKRVNTFEDFRTELVEGKEKRAGIELI
ncbi:hypothetical protein Tco_0226860 [Tanacetum coccineum]